MPPMQHVAFLKLAPGGAQDLFARELRLRIDQGRDILQLIAEAEGAA